MPETPVLSTSARLLRLLSLLQTRPEWPGADLARRLEVTPRTLRRDVQRLRDLDYPVHSVPGVGGGYRLGSGAALPPLQLDDDEAIAVVIGLRGAAGYSVTGLAEASVSALAKLDQILPARLRRRTAALQQATVALSGPGSAIDSGLLTLLASACRGHQRIAMRYQDHGGSESARVIEPYRLVTVGYRWYLMAFDTSRDDWRTFRVDRIAEPSAAGRFPPREPPDAAEFVGAAVTTAPYRYQARVLLHASAATLADQITPATGILTEVSGHRCELRTGSNSLGAMTAHLLALGVEFTVLEPAELIETVREVAARLSRAAGPAGAASPAARPAGPAPGQGSAGQRPR
jgi:predicted DNA-binding transcriptional regulator YafY